MPLQLAIFKTQMRNPALRLNEPDPALLNKLALIEQGYLAVVTLIALGALCGRFIPSLSQRIPGGWVNPQIAVGVLLGAASLGLSSTRQSARLRQMGVLLAALLALLAAAILLKDLGGISTPIDRFIAMPALTGPNGSMAALPAATILALAISVVFIRARKGIAFHLADLLVLTLCILVVVLVSEYMLEGLSNSATGSRTSILTLLAFALLAFVAFMRRAEHGTFASFFGAGSGSRIARLAAPLVLLVPFLPQTALVHIVKSGLLRPEYLSTVAALFAAGFSLALMLFMAWKMNNLERKIRDLSFRDDLTGLLNRRGFHLVAWQALRQARRSGLPFSVMFIVLENLAEINESHGYQSGTSALIEMTEILKTAFRDTDVLGRIDPDQFALAGHFAGKAISVIRLRLQEAVNYRNSDPGILFKMEFSIGCVSAKDTHHESLEDLLAQADNPRESDQRAEERTHQLHPQNKV